MNIIAFLLSFIISESFAIGIMVFTFFNSCDKADINMPNEEWMQNKFDEIMARYEKNRIILK